MPASRIRPKTDVSQGPRIGLRQNERRNGPGSSSGAVSDAGGPPHRGRRRRPPARGRALVGQSGSWARVGLLGGRRVWAGPGPGRGADAGVGHAAPPDRRGPPGLRHGRAGGRDRRAGWLPRRRTRGLSGSQTHAGRTRAPVTGRNQASGTPDSSICGQRR